MDKTVLPCLCRQPSAAATVRVGLQSGQLPAAGGAAPSGASLDIDDVAGETDQDRGESRAPFPEDRLSVAEVAVPRELFQTILERIGRLRLATAMSG